MLLWRNHIRSTRHREENEIVKTFTAFSCAHQKDSERFNVKGELIRTEINYTIEPEKGEAQFTNPPRAEDIVVIYLDTFQARAVGCGRGLADRRKKSGGYKADAHRAVIIELDNL